MGHHGARDAARAAGSGAVKDVTVFNVEGAGGTIGLAKFANEGRKDPHKLMVMGLVMIGAIKNNKAPVDLTRVTSIAALTAEAEAILERDAIVKSIDAMHPSSQWQETLKTKGWADFYIAGADFDSFLDAERKRVEGVLADIGLTK